MAEWGQVIDITEVRIPKPNGEVENFYRYLVTTKGGVTFTKIVPEKDTTPGRIEPILSARAIELDKTKSL